MMRCRNCHKKNPEDSIFCSECGSNLSTKSRSRPPQPGYHQYPQQQENPYQPYYQQQPGYPQQPPQNEGKSAGIIVLIVVIIVCVGIALTVVMAGVLYVWVTSLADTSSYTTTVLGISAKDAAAKASVGSDPKTWATTDDFIVVEHLTGSQINWSKYLNGIKVRSMISDTQYQLTISKVKGNEYSMSNCQTNPGDILILRFVSATTAIKAGDSVILSIIGPNAQYRSPSVGFVVN